MNKTLSRLLTLITFLITLVLLTSSYASAADNDGDGIDQNDNCAWTPNGPIAGTCTTGLYVSNVCDDNDDCDPSPGVGFCSMLQEDTDNDGFGDACDYCDGDGGSRAVPGSGRDGHAGRSRRGGLRSQNVVKAFSTR